MYFDAVLYPKNKVLFNGTREETIDFLAANKGDITINRWDVVPGDTPEFLDVDTYLQRYSPTEGK